MRKQNDSSAQALDRLPFIRTTVCNRRIRASYNGGLIAVRRERGILSAWSDLFSRSVAAGLKPFRGRDLNVRASTGLVGREASEYWGSNQAAAALAIWSRTKRVVHFPDTYNLPLHLVIEHPELRTRARTSPTGSRPSPSRAAWTGASPRTRRSTRSSGTAPSAPTWPTTHARAP